jgi:hypothetical protein
MDSLQKCPSAFVVVPTGMGSFDYVRLTPHFAQDDRVCGDTRENKIQASPRKITTKDTKVAPRHEGERNRKEVGYDDDTGS